MMFARVHDRIRARTGDRGFVIAVFALMLTTMLVFAGFSVDVGAWYARGSQAQRAADAAALAGVVWMPDIDAAREAAYEAARRNGFDRDDDDITVVADPVQGNARQLEVRVGDARVTQYFSQLVIDPPSVTRSATAEYVLPVPLGSPDNQLGGSNFVWASISGQTAPHQNGDPYATRCSGDSCNIGGAISNPNYRPSGYLYAIDVPPDGRDETLTVELYDAGNYPRSSFPRIETADYQTSNIQFELFRADNTPLDINDNLVPEKSLDGRCSVGPGRLALESGQDESTYRNQWAVLCSVDVGDHVGQWVLQVKSSDIPGIPEGNHTGFNQYAIRSFLTGAATPRVYAINDMSLFNNVTTGGTNVNATFYLAEVESIHAGKTLQINLFDPGDGTGAGTYHMNVRGPGGGSVQCTYGPRGSGTNTISPCRIQTRFSNQTGGGIYNNQWLDIEVDIPSNYNCGSDCWWTILYEFQGLNSSSSPYDRTVWSASIIGDPVRLVD